MKTWPAPVVRALRKLGRDIRDARRRRRIPAALLAERASMSRSTLHNVERGSAVASIGNYAAALQSLGMIERLADLADVRYDTVGLDLDEERLPKRIRLPKRK